MEIEVDQNGWSIKYGDSRDRKATIKVGSNEPHSMRVGDEFTLSLVLPHNAVAGDSVSVKIQVVSID